MDWLAWTIIYTFFGLFAVFFLGMMVADLGWKGALQVLGALAAFFLVVGAFIWAMMEVST